MKKLSLAVGETTMLENVLVWRRDATHVYVYNTREEWNTMRGEPPFPYDLEAQRSRYRSYLLLEMTGCSLPEVAAVCRIALTEPIEVCSSRYTSDVVYTGLHDYHAHHGCAFNTPKVESSKKWRVGVELETQFRSAEGRKGFFNLFRSNWVYAERDGSLNSSCGAEFITVPLAVHDAKDVRFWRPLVEVLTQCRAYSYECSCTGLHVHIGREVLGENADEVLGRLLYLYFYVQGEALRRRVMGRTYGHYNTQLVSDVAGATKVLPESLRLKGVVKRVCDSLKSATDSSRYYSINLKNPATIEFRDGKGTLCASRIAAIVEYCELLCLYAKGHTMQEMSEAGLVEYCKSKISDASPLYNYINEE